MGEGEGECRLTFAPVLGGPEPAATDCTASVDMAEDKKQLENGEGLKRQLVVAAAQSEQRTHRRLPARA